MHREPSLCGRTHFWPALAGRPHSSCLPHLQPLHSFQIISQSFAICCEGRQQNWVVMASRFLQDSVALQALSGVITHPARGPATVSLSNLVETLHCDVFMTSHT